MEFEASLEGLYYFGIILIAYLIGSIPTSVWVGKLLYGIDVRDHGSGNAGATNTQRTLGMKAAIPVLIFDIFKGWIAIRFVFLLKVLDMESFNIINLKIYLGLAAVFGHIFPVYVGFRGGKGVATLLGIGLALLPYATLTALGVFIITFILFHYVSLGALMAGLSFPFSTAFIFTYNEYQYIIFAIVICLLLFITHQENIKRLLKKEESKFCFSKK